MSGKKNENRCKEIRNSKAFHEYVILEKLEAGLVLQGTEVKSIRNGKAQINDAFVRFERAQPVLFNAHIDEYTFGNINNHATKRARKLLLRKRQIQQLKTCIEAEGQTVIPLKFYFKEGLIKVELAICKGKKLYDKREDLKRKTILREADRYITKRYR
ncbi:MAG: SsrA-binding protein [Verrucomicrobia bacterium GWC2_42_7]|nr:MAG: SsrA-binding protein [Verrucomicrobia bacterium GWC2_42_7]